MRDKREGSQRKIRREEREKIQPTNLVGLLLHILLVMHLHHLLLVYYCGLLLILLVLLLGRLLCDHYLLSMRWLLHRLSRGLIR